MHPNHVYPQRSKRSGSFSSRIEKLLFVVKVSFGCRNSQSVSSSDTYAAQIIIEIACFKVEVVYLKHVFRQVFKYNYVDCNSTKNITFLNLFTHVDIYDKRQVFDIISPQSCFGCRTASLYKVFSLISQKRCDGSYKKQRKSKLTLGEYLQLLRELIGHFRMTSQ